MTPTTQTQIPLDELIKQMGDIETNTVTETDSTQVDPGTRIKDNVDVTLAEDDKLIAQNLLTQAVLLEEEATKKRAEAVRYDPSLLDKASKPAKKGRGRPAGTTAKAMAARSADANVDA
jgi:hypothetical protein